MSRVGWAFLVAALLAVGALVATTSFGGGEGVVRRVAVAVRPAAPIPPSSHGLPAMVVPVAGVARAAIADTWGQARGQGRAHHGTDIPAPGGTPVLAVADGWVEKLFASVPGGLTLYERSTDGRWIYYYAHLSAYAPGLTEGQAVRAGQPIAAVGDTGDAGAGNTHLHFGVTRMRPGERWWQGEPVDATPALAGPARPG